MVAKMLCARVMYVQLQDKLQRSTFFARKH